MFLTNIQKSGLLIITVIILAAVFAQWIAPEHPNLQERPAESKLRPPSSQHLFGTDQFGRDVLSRIIFGGRISLLISVSVVATASIIGFFWGATASYFGGVLDYILMKIVDVFLSFPTIFLIITLTALFGSNLKILIIVLSLTSWMDIARLVRAEIHSLKQQPFILKAKSMGLGHFRIITGHFLPNVATTLAAIIVMRIADIILVESALSFIGLGVQPPVASWGSVIGDGKNLAASAWWISFFPGIMIVVTILSFYLVGNGFKKAKY
jgi:peptide/nickel transport system permease protein